MNLTLSAKVVLVAACIAAAAPAQVPEGWAAFSFFQPSGGGPGGVLLAHPRGFNNCVAVAGLGSDLTGAGQAGAAVGAGSLLCRESDGALLVGEHTPSGSVDIHLLTVSVAMSGSTMVSAVASSDTVFPIGTVAPGLLGSVDQMAFLSDTTVLFSIRGLSGGPLAGSPLAMLDLTTGATTSIPVTGTFGTVNALAYDPVTSTAYLGFFGGGPSNVYKVYVPFGGAAQYLATVPADVAQLTVDGLGALYVSHGGAGSTLSRIDLSNGTLTALYPNLPGGNALTVEQVTGDLVFAAFSIALNQGIAVVGPPSGPAYTFATQSGMPLSTAYPSGVAVRSTMRSYGPATPGTFTHWFRISPNPGGLPAVGNMAFSVTVDSSLGSPAGVLGISTASWNGPALGLTILIDPNSLIALINLPAAASVPVSLPIPAVPALYGFMGYLQTVHLDPGGYASSAGLKITLL